MSQTSFLPTITQSWNNYGDENQSNRSSVHDDMMTGLHGIEYETEILVLILELSRTLSRLPCVPTAPLTVHTPARAGLSRALI